MSIVRGYGGVIVLEGSYQGKNLYVQNPFSGTGAGYCITEVQVNEELMTEEIQSSAFEIDFSALNMKQGDKLVIRITHKDQCKPRILNENDIKPASTFEVTSFRIDENKIRFTTQKESGPLPFVVEQYRWNKWVRVTDVFGKGSEGTNEYEVAVVHHSGLNKYRLKQVGSSGTPRYSAPVDYTSSASAIAFTPVKASKDLTFTAETMYEIIDSYGNVIRTGAGRQVDVSFLSKGNYYLNYDNKTDSFVKK
jgi:hypothetical protein